MLRIGRLRVDPATRVFEGPQSAVTVRPQVMRVFLLLHDAEGAVVTRDELVEQAWAGRFVAEDSLNGAVSEVRRALRSVGAEGLEVVTVPKAGYRLQGAPGPGPSMQDPQDAAAAQGVSDASPAVPRRWMLGGAAALGLAAATGALLWRREEARARKVDQLLTRGLMALRQGLPQFDAHGVEAFRQATALDPGNARAWGLLALSLRAAAEYGTPQQASEAGRQAELAARRALSLDARQSDALTALALLTPSFGEWLEAERRLRAVLAIDPDNIFAMSGLSRILMSTGQARACLASLDRQVALDPLSPNLQFRRVYTLWSLDRLNEADAVADRALQQWPRHPAVWFARMWTFAFTGRAPRALAMLADRVQRPEMPPPMAELFALSLKALEKPGSPLAAAAIRANLAAAARGPGPAVAAIMVLSGLGAGAQALEVARGFLLQRGEVVVRQRHTSQQPSVTDQHHRMTMMLWIPATQSLRREPGFPALCAELGLVDYWREARVRPDFTVGPSQK